MPFVILIDVYHMVRLKASIYINESTVAIEIVFISRPDEWL